MNKVTIIVNYVLKYSSRLWRISLGLLLPVPENGDCGTQTCCNSVSEKITIFRFRKKDGRAKWT